MKFNHHTKQRITQAQKDAKDKQWYKDQANLLDSHSFSENHFIDFAGVSSHRRKKINYDLFNNIINKRDFEYVCKPFGAEAGDLPANFTNRDIVSGKIKVLLGMEMSMPFSWKLIAVNEEATTRKEQEEASQIRTFVTNEIMRPIQEQIAAQTMAQTKGKELTPEEQAQLQEQIRIETESRTPDEVRKYMVREHQDPAEMLGQELLQYLIQKEKAPFKFNKGWKHSNIAGEEIYFVGILNGEPSFKVVNPLYFDYDKSPDLDFIEDGEWAVHEFRMTPSEVVATFGSQLTNAQIDRIYEYFNNPSHVYDTDFTFDSERVHEPYTLRVLHCNWKSLRKIGFLDYYDENDDVQSKMVDENYKLNPDQGDIRITWEWIPEAHEVYKILDDIYVYARPVPGQHKDLDNLYNCKLSYYGAAVDNLNSVITAPMDRIKAYQYYYNVVLYRIELLMASDKGKMFAANINAVPKSAGIDLKKFMYFLEANKIAWFNPAEEGNKGGITGDVTNLVKEIDMSLASDIAKYIQIAEYIERKCGDAIGITKAMEGAIAPGEAVTNTKQNIIQSSHIIKPYFELHNTVKANVLTALIETAKVAYSGTKSRKLSYVLDDMSIRMLDLDVELLENTKYGLFVANSSKAHDAKQAVETLAQAALQNQQADLADIIKVIRSESITEAEELLEAAQMRKTQEAQAIERQRLQAEEKKRQLEQADLERERVHEKDMIILKEGERRKTEIQKQTILSAGFNEDKDIDDDGTPDVLEIAQFGVDAQLKDRKQTLDERKFDHQREVDEEKLKIDRMKAKNQGKKSSAK